MPASKVKTKHFHVGKPKNSKSCHLQDLNRFPLEELIPSYYVDEDYPARTEIQ